MANNCLVTKLKGIVNTELPSLNVLKFHLPDDAPNGTYFCNLLNTVVCHIEASGGFTDGTTSYDMPANYQPNLFFNKVDGGENVITFNNIYTIKDIELREAFCIGMRKDSNFDSIIMYGNLRGIHWSCADTNEKSAKPNFYKSHNIVALDYDGPYYDIHEDELIKNNPNLKYIRVSAKFTNKLMLVPECRNLTLTSDWRFWNGNIEYFPVSITQTQINTENMWGSLDSLVERIRVTRPSGSIFMRWLNVSPSITIGGVSAANYCAAKGGLSTNTYLVWDTNSIDIVDVKPDGYDNQKTYTIYSPEVRAAITA